LKIITIHEKHASSFERIYLPTWVIYCSLISTFHMLHSRVMQFLFLLYARFMDEKFAVGQLRNCFQFSINLMKLSLSLSLSRLLLSTQFKRSITKMHANFSTLSLHFVCFLLISLIYFEMPRRQINYYMTIWFHQAQADFSHANFNFLCS
jgi:hypothetical protein